MNSHIIFKPSLDPNCIYFSYKGGCAYFCDFGDGFDIQQGINSCIEDVGMSEEYISEKKFILSHPEVYEKIIDWCKENT